MKRISPIYDLLHQEIKACADHLIQTCHSQDFTFDIDSKHILARTHELHQFAKKMREAEHYHPLSDLKHYFENTMVPYHDNQNKMQSMRLSEAVEILHHFPDQLPNRASKSLLVNCIHHMIEEIKPGRSLFKKLRDLNKI